MTTWRLPRGRVSTLYSPRKRTAPCPLSYKALSSARLLRISPPVGKSGPLTCLRRAFVSASSIDHRHQPIDHLAEIVRRDVGRHADGDAGRSVHQQLRHRRRQHDRLLARRIVGRPERYRLALEVLEQRLPRPAPAAPRCSASLRLGRRRASRSCPRREPADSEARRAAPCAPSPRTRLRRRAGDTCRAPRRPRRPTCAASRPARGRGSGTSRRGSGAVPASGRRARRAAHAR